MDNIMSLEDFSIKSPSTFSASRSKGENSTQPTTSVTVQTFNDDDFWVAKNTNTTVSSMETSFINSERVQAQLITLKSPVENESQMLVLKVQEQVKALNVNIEDEQSIELKEEEQDQDQDQDVTAEEWSEIFQKGISALHQDVADVFIKYCLSYQNGLGFIKDSKSGMIYKYDNNKSSWIVIDWVFVERKSRRIIIEKYYEIIETLKRQISQNPNESLQIRIRRIVSLIGKLKTQSYIRSIEARIQSDITTVTTYKPYHRDIGDDVAETYNVFPGFVANKVNITNPNNLDIRLQRLLSHIYEVWANQNVNLYWYILSWLAYPIRNLRPSNIALVVIGRQGCGKSMIFEFMSKFIYGSACSAILENFDLLLQRFNGIREDKMFIVIDETKNADSKKFNGDYQRFKPCVTQSTIPIERKGLEVYHVDNYNTFGICSNHGVPVRLEEDDRRSCVIECSDKYVNNTIYFNTIYNECFNQEVGDLFYSFLRGDFLQQMLVSLIPVPMTAAKQNAIDALRPNSSCFFDDLFVNGPISIPVSMIVIRNREALISTNDVFLLFQDWCKTNNVHCTYKLQGLTSLLHKYPHISDRDRIQMNGVRLRYVSIGEQYHNTVIVNNVSLGTTQSLSQLL